MKKILIIAGVILAIGALVSLGLTQKQNPVVVTNSLQFEENQVIKQYLDEILVEAGYDAEYVQTGSTSELILIREGKADIIPFRMDNLDERFDEIIKVDEPLLEAISVLYVDSSRPVIIGPQLRVGIIYGYTQSAILADDAGFEDVSVYNTTEVALSALFVGEIDAVILPWTSMSLFIETEFPNLERIVLEQSRVFDVYLYINRALEGDIDRIAEAIRTINSSERYRDLVVIPDE